jgi:hypothetical protein
MEANKAFKIGAQEQDVADLSQVGSNQLPQGQAVEEKRSHVSVHARDKRSSDHRENKQHVNMAVHLQTSFPSLAKIVGVHCSLCVCVMPIE